MSIGRNGATAYQSEAVQAAQFASPHQLVKMLVDGAVERVVQARGAMERGMTARKGERIGKAISIVDSLRASLDMEKGGEVAANLASLYDYIGRRLLHANLKNDAGALEEVLRLLREIQAGWDGIADSAAAAAS
ncbi:MAG: flagellar export chaperone FliS [Gammaproteobacteria bacterium]|nr:flagellar export chaperone FliS [Gammaproteobacteria bacterium]|tara:strand:+ start:2141 stop:2542 length:402 start_codon:yes stop_codon:yes gene_type:complete